MALRALGFPVKKVDVLQILKDVGGEETGEVTLDDFVAIGALISARVTPYPCDWCVIFPQ